jgi:hypothetical protein
MWRIPLVIAIVACTSCATTIQSSVRTASVRCDNGFFWVGTDVVLGSTAAWVGTRVGDGTPLAPPTSYLIAGTFAASALYGLYKRHNCVHWQETAPPEVWQAVIEAEQRQAAANAEAQRHDEEMQRLQIQQQQLDLQQQQLQQPPPAPDPGSPPPPPPVESYSNRIHLECNGQLLVDQAFSSRDACTRFVASHVFKCSGLELPMSC